jgi:hypothetical protein
MAQAVLTVVPGKQPDLADAVGLAAVMKYKARIYDWRLAGSPGGISVILNDNAASNQRLEIAGEFKALGYNVIEVP